MNFIPLTKKELISVIEGKSITNRIPMMIQFWSNSETFGVDKEEVDILFKKYPCDVHSIDIRMPDIFKAPEDDPNYRWLNYSNPFEDKKLAFDAHEAISEWSQLDDILANFPDANYTGMFPGNQINDGRYRVGQWWCCFFERHWTMRGMSNALMDFYTDTESVHRLYRALTDFYMRVMERAKYELNLDGMFTSDDIGTQHGPFFSSAIFNEFFKPYYKELIDKAHSLGMHFWLHTCGNIELFLPDFVEIGLDVIHPIQKYTMEEKMIAQRFGKDICIWAGFDVQQVIPWGTPEEVRQEVRFMIDTYYRSEGRLMITAGNGITSDCKIESMKALLDETYNYGLEKVAKCK